MGGRCARRLRRAGVHLGLSLSLSLSLSLTALAAPLHFASQESTPPSQADSATRSTDRRTLELVRSLGASDGPRARKELASLCADLRRKQEKAPLAPTENRALLWATLADTDAFDALAEPGSLAARVLKTDSSHSFVEGLCDLAQAGFLAGQMGLAERAARFAVEHADGQQAWTVMPRPWYLLSEIARKEGRWDDMERFLKQMEAWVFPDRTFTGPYERFLVSNRDYRARLSVGKARLNLENGLLEEAKAEQAKATEAAALAGLPETLALAHMLDLDVALMSQSFRRCIQRAQAAESERWFDELPPELRIQFRVVEGTAWHEQERLELLGAEPRTSELSLADSAGRRILLEAVEGELLGHADRIKLLTMLADGALLRANAPAAIEHLERIESLLSRSAEPREVLRDAAIFAAQRWRATELLVAAGDASAPSDARRRAARTDLKSAIERVMRQWSSLKPRAGGVGFLHLEWRTYVLGAEVDALRRAQPGEAGDRDAMDLVLQIQAMGSLAREQALTAPSIESVRGALLDEDRALLILLPGRNGSHVFWLSREELICDEVPALETLRALARPVMTALRPPGRPMQGDNLQALNALGDALLPASIRARIGSVQQLYVLGFDRVRGLPFGSLTLDGRRPLAESIAVSALSSIPLTMERLKASHQAAGAWDALLAVAPDPPGVVGIDALPFGADERKALLGSLAPRRAALIEPATAERIQAEAELKSAPIVFVLAHTLPDEDAPGSVRLVLSSNDGRAPSFLSVEDVRGLELRGVVLLASCAAAAGPSRVGDDALAHLGGAFLEAGAHTVVIARDRVEYRRTLELFGHVLAELAAGHSTSEALRAAYAATLGEQPWVAWSQAGFQVLGTGFKSPLAD